jgi:adenosine/AMP kinase
LKTYTKPLVNTVPQMKFGIAFNEASGPCLTRVDGNDDALKTMAARNATAIAAGHIFVIAMREGLSDQRIGPHPRGSGSLLDLSARPQIRWK